VAVRGTKLIAFMMMLSLLFACLVSVPVFSGENPWDADGSPGGSPGDSSDSTVNVGDGQDIIGLSTTDDGSGTTWINGVIFSLSYQFSWWVMNPHVVLKKANSDESDANTSVNTSRAF
jgi:hypothetical protein